MTDEQDDFFSSASSDYFDDDVFLKIERGDFIELRDAHNHTVVVVRHLYKLINFCLFLILFLGASVVYTYAALAPIGKVNFPQSIQQIEQQQEAVK